MGRKNSMGKSSSAIFSRLKIKNSLLPVAMPRLMLKKSDRIGVSTAALTSCLGNLVHLASLASSNDAIWRDIAGAACVPPYENSTVCPTGGLDFLNQTTAEETSASSNWTSFG